MTATATGEPEDVVLRRLQSAMATSLSDWRAAIQQTALDCSAIAGQAFISGGAHCNTLYAAAMAARSALHTMLDAKDRIETDRTAERAAIAASDPGEQPDMAKWRHDPMRWYCSSCSRPISTAHAPLPSVCPSCLRHIGSADIAVCLPI